MVPGDHHLRPLADDVAAEADPRPTGKFKLHARGLAERLHDGDAAGPAAPARRAGSPPDARARPADAAAPRTRAAATAGPTWSAGARQRDSGGRTRSDDGQIDEKDVHRPTLEQRAGDAQPFIRGLRREDHEPLQPHAAGDRLNRVERAGEVQVRDDRPAGLGLRDEAQRERGLAAGRIAVHRDAGCTRQTARAEDRVQSREAGGDDAAVVCRDEGLRFVQRHCCKRADDRRDLPRPPSSAELRHPSEPEGSQGPP